MGQKVEFPLETQLQMRPPKSGRTDGRTDGETLDPDPAPPTHAQEEICAVRGGARPPRLTPIIRDQWGPGGDPLD